MKMDLRVHAYFVKLICLFLFCFFGISTNLLAQPTITSFSPTSAKPGDVVTITGTNFNTTTTNNIVFFGATQATVTAATATSLTVTVPTGATFDYITELNTISGLACASNSKFTPVFSPNKSSIGTNDFSTKVDFTTGTLPFSVAIGDLDGDGKPDLAVANRFSNTVSIYRNTSSNGSISSSSFAAKVDFTTGSFPNSVAIGDIDGDGKPDLVVANSLSNAVSVFRNMSSSGSITSSSFSAKVDFTTGTLPFSVAIGDIDGDGKPDLAVANVNSNNVSAFRNTSSSGSISFAAKVDFYTGPGSTPYSVAIGDIDGDGKLDLAVANYANSTVSIFPNESSSGNIISNFGSRVDFTTGLSPVSVAIGDLDGDGKLDLAVANADDNTVSLLRNTSSGSISSGSFAAKVDFAIGSGSIPFSVSIGDINGDGKPDLAVANNGTNTVSVFRNMSSSGSIGSGSFAAKVDFATGSAPISVAIGDLDGDGKPDLVAANNSSNSVSVLRNTYIPPTITSFTPTSAKPGDAVTITGTNFNTTTTNNIVFFGATKATVTAATTTSLTVTVPTGATFDYITELNIGTGLACASTTKFTPVFSPNKTSIGTNDFSTKVDFTTGAATRSVAIGDIDGDGKPDLVVANSNSNTVSVFRNTSSSGSISSGSFSAKVDFTTGSGPLSVAIGDIDGDGKPDLVVANFNDNTVSVFRNTSSSGSITSSSFAAKVDFATGSGSGPYWVAIGDIDGDGKPDLAVANQSSNTVSVLRNTSSTGSITSSSFAANVDFATGSAPVSVVIGDIDGDGKPDLAVVNSSSYNVSVLRNTSNSGSISSSSFATNVDFATGSVPISVAIGDIDGDGKPDLAVANFNGGISVLRNTSSSGSITSSSFSAKVDFTTGFTPFSVAIGDIDGDGKPDLAVVNNGSNTVSIYRNTSSSGSIASSSFAAKVDFATGSSPRSVAIGDIDGDGKPDLAIANSSGTVSVLRNADIPPTITSFTPTLAKPGDAVTITGTNFNTTTTNNIVFFGATRATVTAATTTSLTVTVPTGATYGSITLLNTGSSLACASLANFNPIYSLAKTSIGTGDFEAKQDFTTAFSPISVAIGDLDGDGKPDLVIANYTSNTVSVFRNTSTSGSIGSGSFAAKQDFTTGTNPISVAVGDLDGDGKPDLAIANQGSNKVSVLRNTSTSGSISSGSFAAKVDYTTGSGAYYVAIGDVDGDGNPDLAVLNRNSGTVSIFRNTSTNGSIGSGSFAPKQDFTTGGTPTSIAMGDLDGDGKPDLVVVNQGSNTVSVLRNTATSGSIGSGSFAAKVDFTTGSNPLSVAVGDLDGDGKPDLAVANYNSNTVSVFRNTSSSGSITSSSFAAKVDFITGQFPIAVAIGDIDGDGKPDLAAANQAANTVSVLRNTATSGSIGSSSFAAKQDFTTGNGTASVAIGDLDGDGKPDLAVANFNSDNVSVLRNADIQPTITSFTPTSAKPGDAVTITGTNFNTTTTNNIVFFGATRATVTAATTTSLTVTVPTGACFDYITELNTSSGLACASTTKFTPTFSPNKGSITSGDISAKVDFTTGPNPYSVAIGDLDGDGKPDLAVANYNSNTVSVFRNTSSSGSISSGSFSAKVDFTTGSGPLSVAIGDIDGDGKPDLAVANFNGNTVSVLRNTSSNGSISSGSFAAKVDFTTGTQPYSVAIGDLDGDGKPDLAVANQFSSTVSIYRNMSSSGSITSSSFAAKVDFTTGAQPYSVAIGDLDGDSKPDLAVANSSSDNVSILRNTSSSGSISSSSFAAKVDFTTGSGPLSVAIGDIDGDGKPDLAVANSNSNTVSVFRNTSSSGSISSSSFAAKVDFTTGSAPLSVAIGDIDGDGKPDLAVANSNSNKVSVFRNTSSSGSISSGSFAAKVDFTTGTAPTAVAIGDIDGDGKPDLAVANQLSNKVSVFRNTDVLTITTSGSLSAVNTTYGTASANTSFSVSGTGLSASLVVTAPTGYQVSTSASSGFGSSVSLTPSSGNVASTTIYVRIPGTTAVGTYTGNVVCSSTGATSQNVATVSSIVSAAALTITHRDANKTYGSTLTGVSGSTDFISSGLVNSETIGSVTVAYGTGAAATDAVGSYTGSVTPSAATGGTFTASNYTITYRTGKIIVAQAALTITASTANKTYGSTLTGAAGSTAFTSSGLQNSETIGTVTVAYGTGSAATANVGTYTGSVTPSAATGGTFTATNYNITYATGNIVVGQAALTITASTANKTYGSTLTGAAGSTAFTSSGLQNSETIGTVTVAYGTGSAATANVGTYTGSVTPSAATGGTFTATNYNITYATGNIIVGTKALTITASAASKTYGTAATLSAYTTSGLVGTDAVSAITLSSSGSAATAAIGTYNIVPSAATGTGLTNYAITYTNGILTVNQATLTITASAASKTYGTVASLTAYTTSGLVNSDAVSSVTLSSTGTAAAAAVGTYNIIPSGATGTGLTNYAITYTNGTLTVNQATLTITASAASKTYGTVASLTAYTTSGLVGADAVSSVTLSSTGTAATAAVGTYTIVPSAATGTGLTNYAITYTNGTLTVNPATLTITASAASKTYGTVASLTAYTTSGLVGSDAVSSVTLSSTGTAATAAIGTYNIVPSAATGTGLTNYAITYTNGTLTVNPATLTITASATSKTYGTVASLTAYTTSGLVGSDAVSGVTLSSTGTAATAAVGTYNIIPSAATGTGLTNYAITYTNGTLTVNPAPLTITATNQSKCFGLNLSLPANGYSVSGLLNSDAVSSVTLSSVGATGTAAINTYPITISNATGTGLTNYNITYTNGVLNVIASATITTQPITTLTQCAGTSASISVSATGSPNFSYQWLLNGTAINGATNNTYTVPSLTAANAGSYTVIVTPTGGCAPVTSNASVWTVNALPVPSAITIPSPVCTGSGYTLTNSLSGGVWSSSNMGVATINASGGQVTPVSQGNTTISYAVTNSFGCLGTVTALLPVLSTPVKPVITRDFSGNLNSSYSGVNIWYNASSQQTVSGVSSSSYNPRANVRLQVQGNNSGCIGPWSDEFVYTTSSIATLYPNPASSYTVASIVSDRAQSITLQLTDMAGKVLQEIPVTLGTGQNPVRINTAALARGAYMLVIKGSGVTYQQFVKE